MKLVKGINYMVTDRDEIYCIQKYTHKVGAIKLV